jgi:multicomponent Na+:H+ antiporter subunit D
MSGPLTTLPPAVLLFVLAVTVSVLPRRLGHGVAVAGALTTSAWLALVPSGAHLPVQLFGFDTVLFNVDVFSRALSATLGFIAAVAIAYSYATGADRRQTAYALAYVGAGMGAALAGDWLTLVVFWELMALFATVLIWHRTTDGGVGLRYAIYHEIGGLALVAGVLLHYSAVGTFLFGSGITAGLPAALAALGIGLNAAFLGLHVWLVETYPRTHVAASVILAAVTTKVGAYTIVRAFPDGQFVLAYVGGAMVLFGVTFAVLQTDMRRLLSYHIVSQVGYMVAGFGAGVALARAGALAHLVNNILYKSLLFMIAGILIQRTGRESLKRIGGLGRTMPLTMGLFLVASLSIAGVPVFNGFISKGMVLDGVEEAGLEILWWALVVGGVGTVVSFAKFGYYAFVRGTPRTEYDDLSPIELGTLGTVAALCVLVGAFPTLLFGLLPADGVAAAKPFSPSQFVKAGAVTATGLVVFLGVRSRLSRSTPVPDLEVVYHPAGRRIRELSVRAVATLETALGRSGGGLRDGVRGLLEGPAVDAGSPAVPALGLDRSIGVGMLAIALVLVLLFGLLLG